MEDQKKVTSPNMLYLEQGPKDTPIQDQFNAWQKAFDKKTKIGLLKEPEVTITSIEVKPGVFEKIRSCTVRYIEMDEKMQKMQISGPGQ